MIRFLYFSQIHGLRKSILKGIKIDTVIERIFNDKPTFFKKGEYTSIEIKNIFLKEKFDLIPVIDDYKSLEIIDLLFWDKILGNNITDLQKLDNY